ncbi:MAG TPA: DUF3332 family protein [Nitrospiraceae bacterium]|jgi:hypothetical protein
MFSALLDAFIFNSIQFWTGDNPVKAEGPDGLIREARMSDTRITVSWTNDNHSAAVTYWREASILMTATVIRDDRGIRLIDHDGHVLYAAERLNNGGVAFVDQEC